MLKIMGRRVMSGPSGGSKTSEPGPKKASVMTRKTTGGPGGKMEKPTAMKAPKGRGGY